MNSQQLQQILNERKKIFSCTHPEKETTPNRIYYYPSWDDSYLASIDVYGIACVECKEKDLKDLV